MRLHTTCVLTALLTFCAAPLQATAADQMTVADLQLMCSSKAIDTQNACRFFILGVIEGAPLAEGMKTVKGPLCIAPGVVDAALVAKVKDWMERDLQAFPEDKALAAAGFVVAAAMRSFPCRK